MIYDIGAKMTQINSICRIYDFDKKDEKIPSITRKNYMVRMISFFDLNYHLSVTMSQIIC